MADILPQRLSSLHRLHLSLGAQMVNEHGWQRPASYASSQNEVAVVQASVGLCDISPVGKLLVQGEDIEGLLEKSFSPSKIPLAGAVARHTGGGLLCRLASDQLLLLTPAASLDEVRTALETQQGACAHLVDMTSGLTGLCLSGPRSQEVLSKLTDLDLSHPASGDLTCAQANLSGVQATIVRADFESIPCYRIFISRDLGVHAWDVITEAGASERLRPFGVEALRMIPGEG